MDTIKKRTTPVGIITLIIGLAVGLGIGVWSVKNSHAGNLPAAQHTLSSPALHESASPSMKNDWDPFRQMERMQEEVNRAIRNMTEQFEPAPARRFSGPTPVTLRHSTFATGKIITSSEHTCRTSTRLT